MAALSALERIRLVGALGAASAALGAAATPIAKIKAAAAVRELLAKLGASTGAEPAPASGPVGLKLSAADPQAAQQALQAHADAMRGVNPDVALFEVEAIRRISGYLRVEVSTKVPGNKTLRDAQIEALELMKSRGVQHGIPEAELHGAAEGQARAMEAHAEQRKELVAEYNRVTDARREEAQERMRQAHKKMSEAAAGSDEELHWAEQYKAIVKEYNDWSDKYCDDFNRASKERRLQAYNNGPAVKIGTSIVSAIGDLSPITAERAKEWADAQHVEKSTVAHLKKQNYSLDALRKDMADFYRMTGGKLSAIRIETARGGRAHASGIKAVGGVRTVAVGNPFSRDIMFHELGHHLEGDPVAMAAANGFLLRRRESPQSYRLRDLVKGSGYQSNEFAYKDSFIDPYVGKIYSDRATEVFSMAMQELSSPARAAGLAAKDPEMFALVTGYITSSMTPAAKALSELGIESSDRRKKAELDAAEQDAEIQREYDAVIKRFAANAPLTVLTSLDGDDKWPHGDHWAVAARYAKGMKADYVGSYGDYHVYSGSFRNPDSGRVAKGFAVVSGEGGMYGINVEYLFGKLDTVSAALAITSRQGNNLWSVINSYFRMGKRRHYGDPRANLIEWAKEVK